MALARGFRPVHLVALALAIPPVYKLAEWSWPAAGPRRMDVKAVAVGRELFNHAWTPRDPLSSGDGLGPVFNANSCVACHFQGGAGGGGPVANNVTVYGLSPAAIAPGSSIPPIGVVHSHATRPEFRETMNLVHAGLPNQSTFPLESLTDPTRRVPLPSGVTITQRNTPALFGDGLLDAIPEDALHAEQRRNSDLARVVGMSKARDGKIRGRVARLPDGRLGRFGWKAEFASLNDFVRAACANELGLSNPARAQATSLARRDYEAKGVDLTETQCLMIGDYLRDLAAPVQVMPADLSARHRVEEGSKSFEAIGCADCHTPRLGPIDGFYSNLLLHDMGFDLASSTGYYGEPPASPGSSLGTPPPVANEWRTPPLWGVADSAPYLHDGRAPTLEKAIQLHGGEASDVAARFEALTRVERENILLFLGTLRAPARSTQDPTIATTAAR